MLYSGKKNTKNTFFSKYAELSWGWGRGVYCHTHTQFTLQLYLDGYGMLGLSFDGCKTQRGYLCSILNSHPYHAHIRYLKSHPHPHPHTLVAKSLGGTAEGHVLQNWALDPSWDLSWDVGWDLRYDVGLGSELECGCGSGCSSDLSSGPRLDPELRSEVHEPLRLSRDLWLTLPSLEIG